MTEDGRSAPLSYQPGWDSHVHAQRRRLARLALRDKLAWLEEAQRLVDQLQSQRVSKETTPPTVTSPGD